METGYSRNAVYIAEFTSVHRREQLGRCTLSDLVPIEGREKERESLLYTMNQG
jgi:hypothetical protein